LFNEKKNGMEFKFRENEEKKNEMEIDFKHGIDESRCLKYFEFSEGDVIGVYLFPLESKFSFSINGKKNKILSFNNTHEELKFVCVLYNKDDSISIGKRNEFKHSTTKSKFTEDAILLADKAVEYSNENLIKKTLKKTIYTTILSDEIICSSTRFYK
jgi:hypothetical protein